MAGQADQTNRQGPEPRSDAAVMLDEFHTTFDYVRAAEPSLRVTLHTEEHKELVTALESEGLDQIARELADVVYVAYGSAWSLGIDLDAAIAEVHASNMSKLDDEGKPIYREDGKVMKGPNFRKPDMSAAIADSPFLGEIVGKTTEEVPEQPSASKGEVSGLALFVAVGLSTLIACINLPVLAALGVGVAGTMVAILVLRLLGAIEL